MDPITLFALMTRRQTLVNRAGSMSLFKQHPDAAIRKELYDEVKLIDQYILDITQDTYEFYVLGVNAGPATEEQLQWAGLLPKDTRIDWDRQEIVRHG